MEVGKQIKISSWKSVLTDIPCPYDGKTDQIFQEKENMKLSFFSRENRSDFPGENSFWIPGKQIKISRVTRCGKQMFKKRSSLNAFEIRK